MLERMRNGCSDGHGKREGGRSRGREELQDGYFGEAVESDGVDGPAYSAGDEDVRSARGDF